MSRVKDHCKVPVSTAFVQAHIVLIMSFVGYFCRYMDNKGGPDSKCWTLATPPPPFTTTLPTRTTPPYTTAPRVSRSMPTK